MPLNKEMNPTSIFLYLGVDGLIAFLRALAPKWNAQSFIQELNLGHRFHFFKMESIVLNTSLFWAVM